MSFWKKKTIRYRYVNSGTMLINATLYLIIGVFLFFYQAVSEAVIVWGLIGLTLVLGLWKILEIIVQKKKRFLSVDIIPVIQFLGLSLGLYLIRNNFIQIFPWLLIVMIFVEGGVKAVSWYLLRENHVRDRLRQLISASIAFVTLLILVFNPVIAKTVTFWIVGSYFILQSLIYYYTAFQTLFPQRVNRVKRKFKLGLPVFLAALIPMRVLREINESFDQDDPQAIRNVKQDAEVGVEVLIHMSEKGFGKTGHVDIILDDKVISYGSYDQSTYRLGAAIADGLIFYVDKDKYLPFVKERSQKTLIGFGIYLSTAEKAAVYKRLETIIKDTYEWFPLAKDDPEGDHKDYASDLYRATGATFHKFHRGPFKTYFVLNTNCVQLADHILGAGGIDLINYSGIVTPGTYLDFMEQQYEIKGTAIITRTIYR